MPRKRIDNQNRYTEVLEALKRNSENLQRVLESLTSICDAITNRNETNSRVLENLTIIGDTITNRNEINSIKIMDKINVLQNDVKDLINSLEKNTPIQDLPPLIAQTKQAPPNYPYNPISNSLTILRCSHWENFQELAAQPRIASFTYLESQKLFEADAAKNNQILVYIGEVPPIEVLLKAWLSKLLVVPQEKIFQGTIKP